jgi:hypothetical protein
MRAIIRYLFSAKIQSSIDLPVIMQAFYGYEYILGGRDRSESKEIQAQVLSLSLKNGEKCHPSKKIPCNGLRCKGNS